MTEAQGPTSSPAAQGVTEQQMADARKAARAAADALMLTDAPLLFPPGQLALAAMRSGFSKVRGLPRVHILARMACWAQYHAPGV